MFIEEENLYSLFQQIKHNGYKLTEHEITILSNVLGNSETDNEILEVSILCLAYGSTFIESKRPDIFKKYFQRNIWRPVLESVFDSIRMTKLFELYIDEIKQYSKFSNWDFDEFETNSSAVEALSNYIFDKKNSMLYNFLIKQYDEALNFFNSKNYDDEEDILFSLRKYLSAIHFANEGTNSYRRSRATKQDFSENQIEIKRELFV